MRQGGLCRKTLIDKQKVIDKHDWICIIKL